MSIIRALSRYWFLILLVLLIIVGLQLVIGFVVVKGAGIGLKLVRQEQAPPPIVSTSMPTATSTPTFTPSSTRTPTPASEATQSLATPSVTPTPLLVSEATATGTFTPTPGPTPIAESITLDVPILMYHYLSEPPADANDIRRNLSISPAQFEAHLAYLRQAGYEAITMKQLAYALSGQETLPPKPIIITFDDGYRDNYENAFPLLQKYSYPGVFYIFTYPLDHNDDRYLSWEMVEEMHRAGMEFGSHGYRHWELNGRDVDFLVYEILGSKEAIEAHINEPVRFFSYPVGRYDALAIQVVESANFWNAVTTEFGIEHSFADRYTLPRIRMQGYDTVDNLVLKLNAFSQ
jgi:peptidoglycan/xylan/chitin deacetylase (PgdA/CDA1 family)